MIQELWFRIFPGFRSIEDKILWKIVNLPIESWKFTEHCNYENEMQGVKIQLFDFYDYSYLLVDNTTFQGNWMVSKLIDRLKKIYHNRLQIEYFNRMNDLYNKIKG